MPEISPLSRLFILLGVALLALLLWVATTRHPPVREYRQYLTEDRASLKLPWSEVVSAWDEEQLKARLQGLPMQCYSHPTRIHPKARLCHVKLKELNSVPTMYANFLFAEEKLQHVSTAIPWWAHEKGMKALLASEGQPSTSREQPDSHGLRLDIWKKPDGAALFYNRDAVSNMLDFNSLQWMSASACGARPCVRD